MGDGSQFTCMLFHPGIDRGIALDSAVESKQFRSYHRITLWFRDLRFGTFYREATGLAFNKRILNLELSKLLSVLQVLAVENSTATFDGRSHNQRVIP